MTRRFQILIQNDDDDKTFAKNHHSPSNKRYAKQQFHALQKCWAYAFTHEYYCHYQIFSTNVQYSKGCKTYTFAFHFLNQREGVKNTTISSFISSKLDTNSVKITDFPTLNTHAVITKPSWFKNLRFSDKNWDTCQRIIAGKGIEVERITHLQMLQDTLESLGITAYHCISNLLYTPVYIFNSLCSLLVDGKGVERQ